MAQALWSESTSISTFTFRVKITLGESDARPSEEGHNRKSTSASSQTTVV